MNLNNQRSRSRDALRTLGLKGEGLETLVAIDGFVICTHPDDVIQALLSIVNRGDALKAYLEACDCETCKQLHGFPAKALVEGSRKHIREATTGLLHGMSPEQVFENRLAHIIREVEK